MTDFNKQSIYTNNNFIGQVQNMDTLTTDLNYANANSISMDSSDTNLYQPPVLPSSDIGSLYHNGVYTGVNEPLNTEYYEYAENNENRVNDATVSDDLNNYSSTSVYHPAPQTSDQTQSTSTFSNNASMVTIATSHGQAVIIMNGDIDLERLLVFIQLCGRVERLYR